MSFFGDVIGAIFQNEAEDARSDAIVDGNRRAAEVQLQMFNRSNELSEPWRAAGRGALDAQMSLLGISPNYEGTTQGDPYNLYVSNNSDLSTAYGALDPVNTRHLISAGADRDGDGQISQGEFGQYHWNAHGQGEGRTLPSTTNPPQMTGTGTPTDPYSAFENSGFARAALDTTHADWDRITDQFGAAGSAISGQHIEALNKSNRANTERAFGNYYSALGGISGTGANFANASGEQGIRVGQQIGALDQDSAYARGSSYGNRWANWGKAANSGVDAAAQWFGSM